MPIFEDLNLAEPITLRTLPDKDGNKKEFTVLPRLKTIEDCIELSRLAETQKKAKTGEKIFNLLCEMMIIHLGKDIQFWKQFSPQLLSKINEYLIEVQNKENSEKDKKKIVKN